MIRVLFVCEHNSGRSQMAEAYLKLYGEKHFNAESAGLEPGVINPYVAASMLEDGIDITDNPTDSVFSFFQEERQYDIVVTVCSKEVSEKCPIFPGRALRFNWPFPDPSKLEGDREEILSELKKIRLQIKEKIIQFVAEYEEKGLKLFLKELEG